MKAKHTFSFLAALALSVAASVALAEEVIDFNGLTEGQIVDQITLGGGTIDVFGTNPTFPGTNAAMIFDSSCSGGCTGDDPDLGSPNQTCPGGGPGIGLAGEVGEPTANCAPLGNVLIISEDLDGGDPDDADNVGEAIDFDFTGLGSAVTLKSMTIMDVEAEEPNATVELFDSGDSLIAMFELDTTGDNGVRTEGLGPTSGVAKMKVTLNGSGAIDNIVLERCGNGILEGNEQCDGDAGACPGECSSECTCPEAGADGCTPGYWKVRQHLDSWAGAAPGDNFNAVFMTSATFNADQCSRPDGVASSNPTLLKALWCKGGGLSALARHGVAAYLNALNGDVDYAFTAAQVKQIVKEAIASGNFNAAKDILAAENERGCPLN